MIFVLSGWMVELMWRMDSIPFNSLFSELRFWWRVNLMSVEMYNYNMVEMSKALFHREHKCSLEGTLKFSRAKLVLTDLKKDLIFVTKSNAGWYLPWGSWQPGFALSMTWIYSLRLWIWIWRPRKDDSSLLPNISDRPRHLNIIQIKLNYKSQSS